MQTATTSVDVDELVNLFAGEPAEQLDDEDDPWVTSPIYSVLIAYEVASRITPRNECELRQRFYGEWPVDQIPAAAKVAIGLGYQRYRQFKTYRPLGRGL